MIADALSHADALRSADPGNTAIDLLNSALIELQHIRNAAWWITWRNSSANHVLAALLQARKTDQ
ncbi:hypothetical protein [Sphingobium sp. Z007]|nr:hypothetical protein [Sphingobium sp. Z007]